MPLGNFLRENNVMDVIRTINGSGNNSTTYIALSSTPINADGTGITEPSGNGYERAMTRYNLMTGNNQYVSNFPNNPTYDAQTGKYSIANNKDIYFKEATGSWGTLGYFAIVSSASGSFSLYAYGSLNTAISPTAGTIPVIRSGDLVITEQ